MARTEGMGRGPEKPRDFVTLGVDKDCSSDPSADQCQRTWLHMCMRVHTCVTQVPSSFFFETKSVADLELAKEARFLHCWD